MLLSFYTSDAQTKNTYQVVSESGYIPFAYWDENNTPTGFDIEILKAIAKVENLSFEYKTIPWKVMFDTLDNGTSDIITSGISITDERKSRFTFTDPYFQSDKTVLLGKNNVDIKNIEELKNLKVGVKEALHQKKL
ncbi:transporter substrate-binding domain-containing protein [Suttonella ornithocola]|uniref:transporter substrate-binding domain-containing protein n=1 Tax=Suttonella ornithocola TaxID=279832 RepID=UPI000934E6F1